MTETNRTIGKLAREAVVSVETIRFYERQGLIKQPPSVAGRYQQYSDNILAQVRYIKIAQALGFTLSEVQALKAQTSEKSNFCGAVEDTVSKKLKAIENELRGLKRLKADLLAFQSRCSKRASDDCPLYDELCRLGIQVGEFQSAGSAAQRKGGR